MNEHFARLIIQIMKDAGTQAGQVMMWGSIESAWLGPINGERKDLLAGLEYAGDHRWVEQAGDMLRLTAAGAAA